MEKYKEVRRRICCSTIGQPSFYKLLAILYGKLMKLNILGVFLNPVMQILQENNK